MASFQNMVITTAGLELLQDLILEGGTPLTFSGVGVGDGLLEDSDITAKTSLVHEVHRLPIEKIEKQEGGHIRVFARLATDIITTDFYHRELGVFTRYGEQEILFAYGNAGDDYDFIPATGNNASICKTIVTEFTVGSMKAVFLPLDSKDFVTHEAMNAQVEEVITRETRKVLKAIPQVDAAGNMTLAGGLTAAGAVNANGGVNIPLAVGAPTDTGAVNRLYAAGLAAVTDAFSVRCYPLPADCSSSNGTVFKTDKEPNSLYFNVPPNSSFTVKCGLVTNARPMHNYSSIRGWVAPVRLPAVSAKFTARFGQMTTVVRMGRDRDAFTLVPDQAAGGYRIGEIIDITFDHVRDADAGGYHIRVREIYYSNAEQKWKMKTTQALAPETSSNNGYPVCVYAVVYEQYQDGGYDTEDRGALWLLHGGNSSRGCVKIATVKGVHCFESIYPFSGYYLDIENTNSWALAGAFLPATMHLHCNNVNPAYYGFSSMESNIIVSEAVEDFVDPEAETTTED